MATPGQAGQNTDSNTHWLKPEQIETMRDAAYRGSYGPRDDAILTLLYDTGLRRSELSAVNREMLDLDAEELRIPAHIQMDYHNDNSPEPATFALDRDGSLRIMRTLRSYLGQCEAESTALFPSRSSPRLSRKAINNVVKRPAAGADVNPYAYEAAGEAEDVSAQTLRHSVA